MEFPVRCFTCGALIGHLYETYKGEIKEKDKEIVLNDLGIERYCCRRMFLGHVDMISRVLKYPRT